MRMTLTNSLAEVDAASHKYLADQTAKSFVQDGGEAVWALLHDWVFPFMENVRCSQWSEKLEYPSESSQMYKDT